MGVSAQRQLCRIPAELALVLGKRHLGPAGMASSISRASSSARETSLRTLCRAAGLCAGSPLLSHSYRPSPVSGRIIIPTGNSGNEGENKKSILLQSCGCIIQPQLGGISSEGIRDLREWTERRLLSGGNTAFWLTLLTKMWLRAFSYSSPGWWQVRICWRVMYLLETCNFHADSIQASIFYKTIAKWRPYGNNITILLLALADQAAESFHFTFWKRISRSFMIMSDFHLFNYYK